MNPAYFYLDMVTHELMVPYSQQHRRIRVLLPKHYTTDESTTYPVVYIHDGQNVFHSREAFSGHSWKIIHTLKKNPDLPEMIIVAIDNDNDNRMNEYAPWKLTTILPKNLQLGGKGIEYSDFVMNVVKPFIDTTYRTKSDKAFTAMIGSSLGANISQFMGIKYQDKIGCLGIFSSANWLNHDQFERFISRHHLSDDQRVFIQVGTQEGDDTDRSLTYANVKQAYINESLDYYQQLLRSGVSLDNIKLIIAADAQHNEEAWAQYLPECLRFLSENW